MFRKFLTLAMFVLFVVAVFVFGPVGCGAVHGTDGKTMTIIGFGRTTNGQTQTEIGVGKGMDSNLSNPRDNTFGGRSNAISKTFGDK